MQLCEKVEPGKKAAGSPRNSEDVGARHSDASGRDSVAAMEADRCRASSSASVEADRSRTDSSAQGASTNHTDRKKSNDGGPRQALQPRATAGCSEEQSKLRAAKGEAPTPRPGAELTACPQSSPLLDGDTAEVVIAVTRPREDEQRSRATQAVEDSAEASFGPGYRMRMTSISRIEGSSERVRFLTSQEASCRPVQVPLFNRRTKRPIESGAMPSD